MSPKWRIATPKAEAIHTISGGLHASPSLIVRCLPPQAVVADLRAAKLKKAADLRAMAGFADSAFFVWIVEPKEVCWPRTWWIAKLGSSGYVRNVGNRIDTRAPPVCASAIVMLP
jgi:hypothetical protein